MCSGFLDDEIFVRGCLVAGLNTELKMKAFRSAFTRLSGATSMSSFDVTLPEDLTAAATVSMSLGFKIKGDTHVNALGNSKEQTEKFLEKLNEDLRARNMEVHELGSVKMTCFHARDMQSLNDLRWDLRDGVLLCMLLKVGSEAGNIWGSRLLVYLVTASLDMVTMCMLPLCRNSTANLRTRGGKFTNTQPHEVNASITCWWVGQRARVRCGVLASCQVCNCM